MFPFITGFIITAIISVLIWLYLYMTYWKRNGINGPGFLEGPQTYTKEMRQVCHDWTRKYGAIVGYYEMFTKCLQISDPIILHNILVKDFDKFSERRYYFLGEIFEDCIVMKRGLEWMKVRSVLSPVFSSSKSKQILNCLPELLDNFFQTIRESSENGKAFNMKANIESLVIDQTMATAFSVKTDNFHEPEHPIVEAAKRFISSSLTLPIVIGFLSPTLGKLFKFRAAHPDTCNFFQNLYRDIVANKSDQTKPDLIKLILENNEQMKQNSKEFSEGLTENEIIAQIIFLILVGNDAIACALYHSFFYIAKFPEIQTKLFNEMSKFKDMNFSSLKSAEYLNAFIDEVLRIDPPINRFDRECIVDYPIGDTGLVIPKGALITVSPYTIHRNPEYFPDPDQFKPERFLDNQDNKLNHLAYLPFGGGPRVCLAVQYAKHTMRYIIARTITQFKFNLPLGYEKLAYYNGTVVNVTRDLMVLAEERH